MDLDDELRQLFTSDRLDVPVRADAEAIIVSGARRLRRRRIVAATASGALAVVVVVAAGVALAGGDPDAMPPATTNQSTPPAATSREVTSLPSNSTAQGPPLTIATTAPTTTPPPTTKTKTTEPAPPDLDFPEIGPARFQRLQLGQSLEEAKATGMLGETSSEAEDTCQSYPLVSDEVSGRVYITDTVQAIVADPVMTPEGVGPGWTVEQVAEVYAEVERLGVSSDGRAIVPVPGNSSAVYLLRFSDGVVSGVALAFADQSCY